MISTTPCLFTTCLFTSVLQIVAKIMYQELLWKDCIFSHLWSILQVFGGFKIINDCKTEKWITWMLRTATSFFNQILNIRDSQNYLCKWNCPISLAVIILLNSGAAKTYTFIKFKQMCIILQRQCVIASRFAISCTCLCDCISTWYVFHVVIVW